MLLLDVRLELVLPSCLSARQVSKATGTSLTLLLAAAAAAFSFFDVPAPASSRIRPIHPSSPSPLLLHLKEAERKARGNNPGSMVAHSDAQKYSSGAINYLGNHFASSF
jgi:hypothetical protein